MMEPFQVVSLADSLDPLKDYFNESQFRFIGILSPT
jgi:hypothetical protein